MVVEALARPRQLVGDIGLSSEILAGHVQLMNLRRIDYQDHTLQITYLLDCRDQGTLVALMDDLRRSVPGVAFSFIDQHGLPSV